MKIITILFLSLLLFACGGPSSSEENIINGTGTGSNAINDWTFDSSSTLAFDSAGLMSSLVLADVDFSTATTPSGFYLVNMQTDTEVQLSAISVSGDELTVSTENNNTSFTLRVNGYGNHVAIHLIDIQGLEGKHNYGLRLYLKTNASVSNYTLNDLVSVSSRRSNTWLTLNWPYLWAPERLDGSYGSVVLYDGTIVDSELDSVLAEIWAVQGTLGHMVHPAGQDDWTQETVLEWVARWSEKFENLAVVSIGPDTQQELYDMTLRWVFPSEATRVYMFSTIWRGEYHLYYLNNEAVQGDAFPNGKDDLIDYSDYLAEQGVHLQLKSLVPMLPRYDERYFSDTHCETRFLSWGAGRLVEAIDTDDTSILFQPGLDYTWEQTDGFIRIGAEIIHFGTNTIDPDNGVWTLSDIERGYIGTAPHTHSEGAEVVGVSHAYTDFRFADDIGQVDSLAEEIMIPYADFLNEVKVGHLHFDGTAYFEEAPSFRRTYTDYMYSLMDRPVTGSRVGGSIPAVFERAFPMAKRAAAASDYWDIRIGPRLHGMGRGDDAELKDRSPSLLDIHFDVMDRIVIGGRRPNFTAGSSGGVLSQDILDNYGFIDEAYALFKDWIKLAPIYENADAEYVESFLIKAGNHYQGEDILVLSKNTNDEYIYTPHRIMGRSSGEDSLITISQEWGAFPRVQNIAAGTSMELTNPYDAQQPQVVIRVKEGSATLQDPLITVNESGILAISGAVEAGEYMKFEGGTSVIVYDENWNTQRTLPATATNFTVKQGNNTITTAASNGSTVSGDLEVQYITLGPVYVLKSNKNL